MNRRSFIINSSQALLLLATGDIWAALAEKPSPLLLSGGTDRPFKSYGPGGLDESVPGWVAVQDFGRMASSRIAVPFLPHKVLPHSRKREVVFGTEKWARQGALVDIEAKRVLRSVTLSENLRFFGHGAFEPSGDWIFCTAMDDKSAKGLVLVLDSRTLAVTRQYETGNIFPHDCTLQGDQLVVMTRGRNQSRLVWMRLSDGSIAKKIDLPAGEGYLMHHFRISRDGTIVVSGVPEKKGGFPNQGLIHPDGKFSLLSVPEKLRKIHGEALSIALDESSGIAGITMAFSNRVCFWNFRNGEFLGVTKVRKPRGIELAPEGGRFLVSSVEGGGALHALDLSNREEIPGIFEKTQNAGLTGSHLTWI